MWPLLSAESISDVFTHHQQEIVNRPVVQSNQELSSHISVSCCRPPLALHALLPLPPTSHILWLLSNCQQQNGHIYNKIYWFSALSNCQLFPNLFYAHPHFTYILLLYSHQKRFDHIKKFFLYLLGWGGKNNKMHIKIITKSDLEENFQNLLKHLIYTL